MFAVTATSALGSIVKTCFARVSGKLATSLLGASRLRQEKSLAFRKLFGAKTLSLFVILLNLEIVVGEGGGGEATILWTDGDIIFTATKFFDKA